MLKTFEGLSFYSRGPQLVHSCSTLLWSDDDNKSNNKKTYQTQSIIMNCLRPTFYDILGIRIYNDDNCGVRHGR